MSRMGMSSWGRLLSNVLRAFKQLNPKNVRTESERSILVGVVGPEHVLQDAAAFLLGEDMAAYDKAADVLILIPTPLEKSAYSLLPRCDLMLRSRESPSEFPGVASQRVFEFSSADDLPSVITRILNEPALAYAHLPLARIFPAFRRPVAAETIQTVSLENAVFVVSTSLGNVIPNPLQPLASLAEAMGDLVVLTANQLRMLFRLAAAYNRSLGFREQMPEILSILGAAVGWRSLARELVSKLPFGSGIVPKAGIAFAGTWVIGDGILYYYTTGKRLTKEQMRERFEAAYERGRITAEALAARVRETYARARGADQPGGGSR